MLRAFSRRTLDALHAAMPLRLAIPRIEPVLALNVGKEIEKDSLVIASAARFLHDGGDRETFVAEQIRASVDVDRRFLAEVEHFPVEIVVLHAEILPFRTRRVRMLHEVAETILRNAGNARSLRTAIRASYAKDDLARLLYESFRLYSEEVRSLSRSVRMPRPLAPLREAIARELLAIMLRVAWPLAQQVATLIARERRGGAQIDSSRVGSHT